VARRVEQNVRPKDTLENLKVILPFHAKDNVDSIQHPKIDNSQVIISITKYEGWNFNSGNYLFTTDTKYVHVPKFYCPSM